MTVTATRAAEPISRVGDRSVRSSRMTGSCRPTRMKRVALRRKVRISHTAKADK
jgi:hypothetical protein